MRQDTVCAHLHYSIRKALGTDTTDKWYTHTHTYTSVYEQEDVAVLCNQAVHTDTHTAVTANRPDITIKNKNDKKCQLINVTITADRNTAQEKAERKLKYKSFCTEIKRMWDLDVRLYQ